MSISLESAIRTCKVETGWASKVESDRFLNPNLMMCPVWNGMDLTGRAVCPDSFYTKRAGCNSAEDRVVVENNVSRPQYAEYINLNANGIEGDIYGNSMPWVNSGCRNKTLKKELDMTGQYGNAYGFAGETIGGCSVNAYEKAMAQVELETNPALAATANRVAQNNSVKFAVNKAADAYDNGSVASVAHGCGK